MRSRSVLLIGLLLNMLFFSSQNTQADEFGTREQRTAYTERALESLLGRARYSGEQSQGLRLVPGSVKLRFSWRPESLLTQMTNILEKLPVFGQGREFHAEHATFQLIDREGRTYAGSVKVFTDNVSSSGARPYHGQETLLDEKSGKGFHIGIEPGVWTQFSGELHRDLNLQLMARPRVDDPKTSTLTDKKTGRALGPATGSDSGAGAQGAGELTP